jgi:hypothetical protein
MPHRRVLIARKSMTPFERLRVELIPPEIPFAFEGDWHRIEAEIGLALPGDYKAFISKYGSGKICGFVSLFSPFVNNGNWSLMPYVSETIQAYESYVDTKVLRAIPYPLYPKRGGLLPFGTTENSSCLNWLTDGPPDEWELVVWDPDSLAFSNTCYRSLAEFLADLVQQRCGLIPGDPPLDWLDPPRSFTAINYDSPEWSKP